MKSLCGAVAAGPGLGLAKPIAFRAAILLQPVPMIDRAGGDRQARALCPSSGHFAIATPYVIFLPFHTGKIALSASITSFPKPSTAPTSAEVLAWFDRTRLEDGIINRHTHTFWSRTERKRHHAREKDRRLPCGCREIQQMLRLTTTPRVCKCRSRCTHGFCSV